MLLNKLPVIYFITLKDMYSLEHTLSYKMDADFGYVVDCEDKITLRVDKQLFEIEEREEYAFNSMYPSLR